MESKPAQNIQDTFLNTVRKDKSPITIYLVSGVKLTGKIRSFDKYSVLLENNAQEQLIFKHAISTVVSGRVGPHTDGQAAGKPEPRAQSGTAEPRLRARYWTRLRAIAGDRYSKPEGHIHEDKAGLDQTGTAHWSLHGQEAAGEPCGRAAAARAAATHRGARRRGTNSPCWLRWSLPDSGGD